MSLLRFFEEIGIGDVGLVGGKNANLGEMVRHLSQSGVTVPSGFATTRDAYALLLQQNRLGERIDALMENHDVSDVTQLQACGKSIREMILAETLPEALERELLDAYRTLSQRYGSDGVDVAVRSSATAEDLPDASFAGQQESFLNVRGEAALLLHVKQCFASLFTDRAISYRYSRGYDHRKVALCVGVQKMVHSDRASSGIMFTLDTQSGNANVITINSVWGLGENIVGGRINPDEFLCFKPAVAANRRALVKRKCGSKALKMIYDVEARTRNIETTLQERTQFSITDDEVTTLARYALAIEEHYGKPMDIEWAKDADEGELYIVQARPETVHSRRSAQQSIEKYTFRGNGQRTPLLKGSAIGSKIGTGVVRVIRSLSEASHFHAGEVLVADMTDPDWEPLMKKASAVVTNKGGRTCHAAIVAREIGVSAVVGTGNATEVLQDGMEVSVSCAEGEEGIVYEGVLDFDIETIDLQTLAQPRTRLMMNVGNPDKAFAFATIPSGGVGLARMEFIINNAIKAHPMALFNMNEGRSVKDEAAIGTLIAGYETPKDFFIERLSQGIAMIAAAFYPEPVIVRTSDFKSNEYRHMLGGEAFELEEENPMIGFRGASRYYSDAYRDAFVWECEALKRVRDEMGLSNVKIMLPFVRTPGEGRKVIAIMNDNGLVQGKNGLEIYAMCEIPSNVIFAEEFLKVFDGYSIGSNDLTQLTLGVDRDSALVAHVFDERNEAVTRLFKMAIDACKKADKYIGICGQAPSDYPEITEFLVKNGIDSISLNPDSLLKMRQVVVALEARLDEEAD